MWRYINPPRSDELYHFGILGMKWGKRRTDAQLGNKQSSSMKKSDGDLQQEKLKENVRKVLAPPRESPAHSWSEKERNDFDSRYKKARTNNIKRWNSTADPTLKRDIREELDLLESEYLSYREWD